MNDFSSGYFCLHLESAGELKSFGASSRNGVNTLKLEVSYGSAAEMGYALEELSKLQSSVQVLRGAAKAKKPRRLALPAPEDRV